MTRTARSLVTAASASVVLSLGGFASAANTTWGPVGRITAPADLIQTGAFVSALNLGGGAQAPLSVAGTDITFTSAALTEAVGGGGVSNSYNATYYDPTTGDTNLDMVLDSHSYVASNNPNSRARVELANLAVGTPYQVQVIGVADIRACCSARIQTIDDGAGNTSGGLQRGLANFVIGTFIADSPTQSLFVAGINDPGLSGLVLRAIPEPTSLTFLAAAAGASLLHRRRRNA